MWREGAQGSDPGFDRTVGWGLGSTRWVFLPRTHPRAVALSHLEMARKLDDLGNEGFVSSWYSSWSSNEDVDDVVV